MSKQIVVFDFDGTLIDSTASIIQCIQSAITKMGLEQRDNDSIRNIIGLGLDEAILQLYPTMDSNSIAQMGMNYRECFFSESYSQDCLYPNVIECLEILKSMGVKMAIATGKSRRGLDKVLKETQLDGYFDITICADETSSKPDPLMLNQILQEMSIKPKNALMIGDTWFDLEMANSALVPAIGVSYGAHDIETLKEYKPLAIVDNIQDIISYIKL